MILPVGTNAQSADILPGKTGGLIDSGLAFCYCNFWGKRTNTGPSTYQYTLHTSGGDNNTCCLAARHPRYLLRILLNKLSG